MISFKGTIQHDVIQGFVMSSIVVKNPELFSMPSYQRDRILQKKKISALKSIFTSRGRIDPITLNLRGDYIEKSSEIVIVNKSFFNVIDGQQRTRALQESGVMDYPLPVIVHYNISDEEEKGLFQQLNNTATALTFGELIRSFSGPAATVYRNALIDKTFPIKISIRGKNGVSSSAYCCLLYLVYRKIVDKEKVSSIPRGKNLLRFYEDKKIDEKQVQLAAYGVKRLFQNFVDIFGTYSPDPSVKAYRRSFLLAWNQVTIDHFMDHLGNINYGEFKNKLKDAPKMLANSQVIQYLSNSDTCVPHICEFVIDFLNSKKKKHRLPKSSNEVQ